MRWCEMLTQVRRTRKPSFEVNPHKIVFEKFVGYLSQRELEELFRECGFTMQKDRHGACRINAHKRDIKHVLNFMSSPAQYMSKALRK